MLSALIALAMMATSAYSQNFSAVQNMGATLNSANNDETPVMSPNGLSLYFTSDRTGGQGGSDIWVSQRARLSSAWGAPQNLGATVNASDFDGVACFSVDGKTMFLGSRRADSLGGIDLYTSTRTDPNNDFGWNTPVNLGPVINSTSDEFSATYFEDPTTGAGTLIFSKPLVGGTNGRFHQSTRIADGTFNAPTLIGELNGPGFHFGAAIRRDGLEIYIASSRPGGLNNPAFDIWVSTRTSISSPWGTPTLAARINTLSNERYPQMSPDGSILYFHSDRAGGFGGSDLYSATRCSLYLISPCSTNRSTADFNGDGMTDISIFRPSDGTWWVMESGTNTVSVRQFGTNGDKIVPGDYDGDGRNDMAVFRPLTGDWWILRSSDNSYYSVNWGLSADKLVPADYDGDGKTDIAIYRDGTWWIQQSTGGISVQQFGLSTDIPVAE